MSEDQNEIDVSDEVAEAIRLWSVASFASDLLSEAWAEAIAQRVDEEIMATGGDGDE